MDKYKVQDQIGKGVLAVVSKVKDDKNNLFVLKEVECLDNLTAQAAFEEFQPYLHTKNRFVCKLHDLYVKWDNKLKNTFICYIMDYYEKADLQTYLNSLRLKYEKVPLSTMKKWFGMIVEGMFYLHRCNLTHRNLKPSSLYLTKDNQLQVGDFGVLTIMKDARTKTRIAAGAHNYTAPEVIDSQTSYDDKSDIWSIATIILDICTTSLYDLKEFQSRLLNLRHSDDVLEEMLLDIENFYQSTELTKLLKSLLKKNSVKRLNYKAIIQNSFIRECLELIDSDLVKSYGSPDAGPSDVPLPHPQTLKTLSDFIISNMDRENRVQTALVKLVDLLDQENLDYNDRAKHLIIYNLMHTYSNNIIIQVSIMKLIEYSLKSIIHQFSGMFDDIDTNLDLSFLKRFIFLFIQHINSKDLQLAAVKVFIELSNFEIVTPHIENYHVIKYLLQDLVTFQDDPVFCGYVCKAIWCLSTHKSILKTYINMNCLEHMKTVLTRHQTNSFCVEMACNVIIGLCMNERIIHLEEIDVDATSSIVLALKQNYKLASVVKSACLALTSLINFFEECAFRFLYVPKGSENEAVDGIELLRQIYDLHKDNCEIVESMCAIFKQLSQYDEMVIEMKSLNLNENLLSAINKRYRDNPDITSVCDFISEKLKQKTNSDLKTIE